MAWVNRAPYPGPPSVEGAAPNAGSAGTHPLSNRKGGEECTARGRIVPLFVGIHDSEHESTHRPGAGGTWRAHGPGETGL
eukprot:7646780-Alexandrium_andersonii.AAC.1